MTCASHRDLGVHSEASFWSSFGRRKKIRELKKKIKKSVGYFKLSIRNGTVNVILMPLGYLSIIKSWNHRSQRGPLEFIESNSPAKSKFLTTG